MLPFLKRHDEAMLSGPVDIIERKPDDDSPYDMLDAVAEDFLKAFETKDKKLLKDALSALCDHLQEMDEQQDKEISSDDQ